MAGRKCLHAQAAQQLRREEEALEKAERNRLLRVRYVAGTCQWGGLSRASSGVCLSPTRGPPPGQGPQCHPSLSLTLRPLFLPIPALAAPEAQCLHFPGDSSHQGSPEQGRVAPPHCEGNTHSCSPGAAPSPDLSFPRSRYSSPPHPSQSTARLLCCFCGSQVTGHSRGPHPPLPTSLVLVLPVVPAPSRVPLLASLALRDTCSPGGRGPSRADAHECPSPLPPAAAGSPCTSRRSAGSGTRSWWKMPRGTTGSR